jgi:predicted phosphodiesterase
MKEKVSVVLICTTLLLSTVLTMVSIPINAKRTDSFYRVDNNPTGSEKTQLSFAAFTDTHIGARYQYPFYGMAGHLDQLAKDLVDATTPLDFAVHLGDIVNHNTGQINGEGLPWYVDQYKNNLKAFFISHINVPFYCVIGNHDVNDYQMNSGNPHNLTESLVNELSMNNPVYAMMYDGILFLIVPELGYVTWTHPVEYEWIEYMTGLYPNTTTIILCHQAIEDTTIAEKTQLYCAKQDMVWWDTLFQNNPQIKMWIHGHNHFLDWYVSNQSTGQTTPIREFGHEIAFSTPYPQMEWRFRYEEDRIVIYNISATRISTGSWENNGAGGHWASGYLHSWNVTTTFNPDAKDWYSFPMFLQDNETQLTDMKLLSPDITLQLIGTAPMELFLDSQMESPSNGTDEIILGFGHDRSGNVIWNKPGMRVHGPTTVTFPEKYPYNDSVQEDGRSGQPYHSFPMGTICAAVPGQTYNFTITARCLSGSGEFRMNVSCSDWETQSQYSMLSDSRKEVFSYTFGPSYETIHGVYTVPNDTNAWFLQGALEFLDSTDYEISLFSVKRERLSDTTENFHLYLSGRWYNVSGPLIEDEMANFSVTPQVLSDADGVMNFTACIDGNRYGMVNLVYREPLLLGMNARFRVNNYTDGVYNLSLTKTISRNAAVKEMLWNSKVFQKLPHVTELFVRFLMKGLTGHILSVILNKIFPDISATFKLFAFSINPLYEQVSITADDGSGMQHISTNGNVWFSCTCPRTGQRFVEVTKLGR